ncbi:hypothetical protein LSH36_137g05045 [Paralvinella palmiformis]|uniref:Uncharacterized protein n=1 Tax=Paralvinella palmiformis TaxID=53620 RepID=A0AAD9JY10_9ANNE|nr:hypothetical protein LSH36_137g05045 [Paralvinella palmiformis]
MPQKKPIVLRNTRHVDGIKEMIDIVRNQQAPVIQKASGSDMTLQRRNPLPGITTSSGGSDASPRSGVLDPRWQNVSNSVETENTDNDLDYDFDNDDFDPQLVAPGLRTPSPAMRSGSVMSSKSSHVLGLSRSLDTSILSKQMSNVKSRRRMSFQEVDQTAVNRSVRNLPPVRRRNNSRRSRPTAPVPLLDLSKVIALTPDEEEFAEASTYSPTDPPSPELNDMFVEER